MRHRISLVGRGAGERDIYIRARKKRYLEGISKGDFKSDTKGNIKANTRDCKAILGLCMELRRNAQQNVIARFMTPILQEMDQTVVELLRHKHLQCLTLPTTQPSAQMSLINGIMPKLKSMHGLAQITTSRKDSRVSRYHAGHTHTCLTLTNTDTQIVSRQDRGGQTQKTNLIFVCRVVYEREYQISQEIFKPISRRK